MRKKAEAQHVPRRRLERQAKMWNGEDGAMLLAVFTKDGSQLAKYQLDALPISDGLIAANGKLYISLTNGVVTCLE
jgi:hypothetical protein